MIVSEAERQIRKVAIASFGQTLRAYWDYEMARPVPDRLRELAATADEVLAKSGPIPVLILEAVNSGEKHISAT